MIRSQLIILACLAASTVGVQAATITNVTSATAIDPSTGNAIKYDSPNWNGSGSIGFRKQAAAVGDFAKLTAAQITALKDVQILNFEAAQGFGTAPESIASSGTIFTGKTSVSPFSAADSISSITLQSGYNIGLSFRSYSASTGALSAPLNNSGVFLVGDRALDPKIVTSGTQGLIGGPSSDVYQGILFNFDSNLSAFSCTMNSGNVDGGPIDYVLLLNAADQVVGTYYMPVSKDSPLCFSVSSSANEIRKVWVGQVGSAAGIVVDDVAFVPVPEPAVVGVLSLGSLAMLWLGKRR